MPGILPMKVIKVGTAAQSRIAQACDRCRSKKIRCDGITPCCTQCANVGFECKTSDKLSRRAFPRGYTESLEERVRSLEGEVKELKDLLDEKDEKIDILSKIHSNSPSLRRPSSTLSWFSHAGDSESEPSTNNEDTFMVQQPPETVDGEEAGSYFIGASSGRQFVDSFKTKVQESGRSCDDIKTDRFFAAKKRENPTPRRKLTAPTSMRPPRMVSDQLINIFFQEWAPLFPVLHRPTLLDAYEKYMADPEGIEDQHIIVQLHFIFGIAASSAEWNKHDALAFQPQWKPALDLIKEHDTLETLQCLILAQIYTLLKADYESLQYYRGIAMPLSQRLGLHQNQKRSSLGALSRETRKKVFWALYTLDCFSAAILGLPKLLKEADIHAEYPADVDDENVSENGFQPTLPGESTRLSSALALFKGARIMSNVLDQVYTAGLSPEVSLQKLSRLDNELDEWLKSLPSHLRLQFAQDKPSTNVCGSRSPILSLAYHYIRTLIHRPAVASSLGHKADSSVVALASSSKHIIQIIQLLEERRMSFSICLNKDHVLLLAGFGLLYQTLQLNRKGKLIQDSQRLLCSVTSMLEGNGAIGAADFKKVMSALISINQSPKSGRVVETPGPRRKSDGTMNAPKSIAKAPRRPSTITTSPLVKKEIFPSRRATVPNISPAAWPQRACNTKQRNHPPVLPQSSSQCRKSEPKVTTEDEARMLDSRMLDSSLPNLDYLDFGKDRSSNVEPTFPTLPNSNSKAPQDTFAGCGMLGQMQPPLETISPLSDSDPLAISPLTEVDADWVSNLWSIPADDPIPMSGSVLSFSEEELTSGEEMSSCDTNRTYNGIKIPQEVPLVRLGDLDGSFAF